MMSHNRIGAIGVVPAVLSAALILGVAPAGAEPLGCPKAAAVDGSACSGRLASVTANATDGTITGTMVGGQSPMTLTGPSDAYLKSTGFGSSPPDAVQQWDQTIDRVNGLPAPGNPPDPNWYGSGKSAAFLTRQLNDVATQFPPDSIVIRFVPDATPYSGFRILSIQPTG